MDVREKLVELIEKASYECDEGTRDLWDMREVADGIADFLIAHGVTVQEWISTDERMPTQEDAPTEYVFTAYKNKNGYDVKIALWDTVVAYPDLYDYWMAISLPQPPKGE